MIKVMIADDHVVMRNGLRLLCESMGDVAVAGEAESGEQVLELLQREHFDLILLDLTMPGISGVELVERIRARHASQPILIFSMRNEAQVAKRVLQAGASGYVTKGSNEEMLISAIRKVAAGGHFVDPFITEQMIFDKRPPGESVAAEHLSERELQILKLLGQGKSVNEIAEELFINSRTVSTHKARLMLKMKFKNNADLILYASESGLV